VNVLEMNVVLYPNEIGQTKTRENLKSSIVKKIEGKCTEEGYIRPGSVEVKQYSAGIVKGDMVEFTVVFQCYSSNPVEGTILECVVKSITKAGIHAEARDHLGNVPVTVFIARDHFVEKKAFQEVTETSLEKNVFVKVYFNIPFMHAENACNLKTIDIYSQSVWANPRFIFFKPR
jgi:DNA-directed RNA polymerase subunit E'/Rpb7